MINGKLILIRGLPGSGKSTLARDIAAGGHYTHLEADQYFTSDDGQYLFDAARIKHAHKWCQATTRELINNGRNVVVSNTFTQLWEMEPYYHMGASGSKRRD